MPSSDGADFSMPRARGHHFAGQSPSDSKLPKCDIAPLTRTLATSNLLKGSAMLMSLRGVAVPTSGEDGEGRVAE